MNRRKVLQAVFHLCIAMDKEPSRRNIDDLLRKVFGESMRSTEICAFIREYNAHRAARGYSNGNQLGSGPKPTWEPLDKHENRGLGATGGAAVEPVSHAQNKALNTENRVKPSPSAQAAADKPPREPQQPSMLRGKGNKLATVAEYRMVDELLSAFWLDVEPALRMNGRATKTKTTWKRENKSVALELVKLGYDYDALRPYYDAACARLASPVWTLKIVQDQLQRGLEPRTPRKPLAPIAYTSDQEFAEMK